MKKVVDEARAQLFVQRLEAAVDELRGDYHRLLERMIETIAATAGGDGGLDHSGLAQRAAGGLHRDASEIEVIRPSPSRYQSHRPSPGRSDRQLCWPRPLSRWNGQDERRALEELASLSQLFHRVEAAAFE